MMDSEDKKIDIEGVDPRELYGPQNIYLEQMQELHPNLKIIARGSALTVLGPRSDSEQFRKRLDGLIAYYLKYGYISKESVQQAFSTGVIEHDAPVDKDVIVYGNNGTIVRARTVNQLKLVQSYDRNDLLLAIGPAGSGKTYTAIALAVRALKEKHVKRIILTRPAVEAGEKLGFLPGDMKEKLDPYLQPLYDALNDMIPPAKLQKYIEEQLHCKICRPVFFKKIPDVNDRDIFSKLLKGACFFNELLLSLFILRPVFFICKDEGTIWCPPLKQTGREVLFDAAA